MAGRLVYLAIWTCANSQPCHWVGTPETKQLSLESPVIFAIWHNRLAFSLVAYRKLIQRRSAVPRRMAALVSASRDGAFLAAILEAFGIQPVRGSTSRRGPQALLELASWAERGLDLAITPDGPRGPRYQVQPGVIGLARVTGLPVIPTACNARWKAQLRSWDRFQIPFPFAGYEIAFGEALRVDKEDTHSIEDWQAELRRRLSAVTRDD